MNFSSKESAQKKREAEGLVEMVRYYDDHPKSPSAVHRPRLFLRGSSWVALLGYTLQGGIAGIGSTVAAALQAFDSHYLASLKRPVV